MWNMSTTSQTDAPERATTGALGPGRPAAKSVDQVRLQSNTLNACVQLISVTDSIFSFTRLPVPVGLLQYR